MYTGQPEKPPQTTIARLLLLTMLIAVVCAVAPNIYGKDNNNLGGILSIVMLTTLALGASIGLLTGGIENMFRGLVAGFIIFFVAIAIVMSLSIIGVLLV
ncbi:MAG: hypothetical protein ABL888_17000 [Pirellulaceae bacterium]